jgi:DNA polymerase-3 subunit epsilon
MTQMNRKLIADRNEAISWARGLMQRTDWFILDTETTGLKQTGQNLTAYDEIIQIGIINPHGKIVFESLVNHVKRRISQGAKDVHGIDIRMLKDAPRFQDVAPKLRDILNGKLVIAYNAEFEKQMFIQTYAKIPQEFRKADDLQLTLQCAMDEYSHFVGEWNDYHNDYKWQKLPRATHNVIGDCLAVLNLIKEMANTELSPIPDPWWKTLFKFVGRRK